MTELSIIKDESIIHKPNLPVGLPALGGQAGRKYARIFVSKLAPAINFIRC